MAKKYNNGMSSWVGNKKGAHANMPTEVKMKTVSKDVGYANTSSGKKSSDVYGRVMKQIKKDSNKFKKVMKKS